MGHQMAMEPELHIMRYHQAYQGMRLRIPLQDRSNIFWIELRQVQRTQVTQILDLHVPFHYYTNTSPSAHTFGIMDHSQCPTERGEKFLLNIHLESVQ